MVVRSTGNDVRPEADSSSCFEYTVSNLGFLKASIVARDKEPSRLRD